eukprot:4149740-Prymnesium_polylepis.1
MHCFPAVCAHPSFTSAGIIAPRVPERLMLRAPPGGWPHRSAGPVAVAQREVRRRQEVPRGGEVGETARTAAADRLHEAELRKLPPAEGTAISVRERFWAGFTHLLSSRHQPV